jgi:hypothetical protein
MVAIAVPISIPLGRTTREDMVSPVSAEVVVSVPNLTITVPMIPNRSITLSISISGLGKMIATTGSKPGEAIAAGGLILDCAHSFPDLIRDGVISLVLKSRETAAAIEVSRRELARADRRAAAGIDVMLTKDIRR